MKIEAIAVLVSYLKNQKEEIDKLLAGMRKIAPIDEQRTVFLGYFVHKLYCAFEDPFKRVARTFENQIDDSSRTTENC